MQDDRRPVGADLGLAAMLWGPLATPLRVGRNCGEAESQVILPVRRRVMESVRRLAVRSLAVPTPAPDHPGRAVRVGTPLPDIAVHVVDAKSVGLI
jgi:hypothetical protein